MGQECHWLEPGSAPLDSSLSNPAVDVIGLFVVILESWSCRQVHCLCLMVHCGTAGGQPLSKGPGMTKHGRETGKVLLMQYCGGHSSWWDTEITCFITLNDQLFLGFNFLHLDIPLMSRVDNQTPSPVVFLCDVAQWSVYVFLMPPIAPDEHFPTLLLWNHSSTAGSHVPGEQWCLES